MRVRFPSTAPSRKFRGYAETLVNLNMNESFCKEENSLLYMSKHGVCASLLTKNELGSIPRCTAKNLGGVVGYGMGLHPV